MYKKNHKTITALLVLISVSFSGCHEDDIPISATNHIYLLDRMNYSVVSINVETAEKLILGEIHVPELMTLDDYDNTNSNLFIDLKNKRLAASAWKEKAKYFLLFDYEKGNLIDSVKLSYPFTNRFFYSPDLETIYSYLTGTLFSMTLKEKQVIRDEIIIADSVGCGVEHQGIDNFNHVFYNYGCNQTTMIYLETKSTDIIDHYHFDPNKISEWILLYSVGLSKDRSYLLGFGNYPRHFPDDPGYIGAFDSVRNELYMVRKNLMDGSFTENRIDLNFGLNNGTFNSETEQYILKHNEEVIIFNADLKPYKTIGTENMSIIKQ
ncbi:MAG: hypothetical protein V2B15_18965 [Bacteroidota bacterium]